MEQVSVRNQLNTDLTIQFYQHLC